MFDPLDRKRILIFLAFAFGIAWSSALVIYLTGGLANSPTIAGIPQLSLALILLTLVYMGAPTYAHILTRLITGEGWRDTYLRPKLRQGWPYWLICWFGPGLLTLLGTVVFFLLFPANYDPSLGYLRDLISQTVTSTGQAMPAISLQLIVAIQILQAILLAPLLNGIPTFGEEFGWRSYLLHKLMPLGGRKAMLMLGIIWGVWHWPVIAMGHNYGLDYPGAPWLGMLMMVWFTFNMGTLFGWAVLRAGSVWPAVIGHAAINGIAGIGIFFSKGEPNLLLGPMPTGLIGSAGFALVTLLIFLLPGALQVPHAPLSPPEPIGTSDNPQS